MDVRNSTEELKSLLGVPSTSSTKTHSARAGAMTGTLTGDTAVLSPAGTEVAVAASRPDIRADKVASIRTALALGTYSVPAEAVASKVVDSMLSTSEGVD